MTGPSIIQEPLWEEDLQTALDYVNSTLGDIDSVGGEKDAYEAARDSLETLLQLVLNICRPEWTAAYPINEWVYNYKRYVKGPSCDCFTVKEKGTHIGLVYSTTSKTHGIASTAAASKRFEKGVADSIKSQCDSTTPDVKTIKKYNCCMDKIERGVHKEVQIFGALSNKRHLNGLARQAEKPLVSQSQTYQNGNHLSVASALSAAAGSSGGAGAGLSTEMLSASLSGILSGALGGNFGAGIFGNASLQLGCESYSFTDGLVANIGGSLGFNFGFSICSPKLGATANVASTYTAGVFASTMASLEGGLDLWSPTSSVNYNANTNGGVLDATISPPFENFDRKKNCKCASDNDAGLAGNMIPPNGNLDSHDTVVKRAEDQTRDIKEKIEELKCKTYCCSKKSKKKKEPKEREEILFKTEQVLRVVQGFPTFNELDKVILTTNDSFYSPVLTDQQILVINGVTAEDDTPTDTVLQIVPSATEQVNKEITVPEKCYVSSNTEDESDDIDLEKTNVIMIKNINTEKNNNAECSTEFFKTLTTCLPIPKVIEVNNDLLTDYTTDKNVIISNDSAFINSVQDLEDPLAQQYFLKSVGSGCIQPSEVYQIINDNIVQIQD